MSRGLTLSCHRWQSIGKFQRASVIFECMRFLCTLDCFLYSNDRQPTNRMSSSRRGNAIYGNNALVLWKLHCAVYTNLQTSWAVCSCSKVACTGQTSSTWTVHVVVKCSLPTCCKPHFNSDATGRLSFVKLFAGSCLRPKFVYVFARGTACQTVRLHNYTVVFCDVWRAWRRGARRSAFYRMWKVPHGVGLIR